jgi:hypothetical protein
MYPFLIDVQVLDVTAHLSSLRSTMRSSSSLSIEAELKQFAAGRVL